MLRLYMPYLQQSHHQTNEGMSKPLTRYEKARPSIEILSVIAQVMQERQPWDWLVVYSIRAWSLISIGGVRKHHILATLADYVTERRLDDSLRRLRRAGYVSMDEESGYIVITKEGSKKIHSFQAMRGQVWARMHQHSKDELVKNFTRNKNIDDGQAEQDD